MIFISDFMRAAGCLVGLAVGDALGAPLEGLPPPENRVTRMLGGGIHDIQRGEFTDDALQAIGLAESLVSCRGFSPEDFMERLVRAFEGAPEFYGPTSRTVFTLVRQGCALEQAAAVAHLMNKGSRTNGSVMRAPPLGIYYPPHAVREVSLVCSALTHYDPVAGECSAFVNQMVSEMCRGVPKVRAFTHALDRCQSPEVAERLGEFDRWPIEPSLDAVLATHAAVAVFMGSDGFENTVVRAINLGGDADTVGAIAGALAGACYGFPSIPHRWLVDLRHTGRLLALSRRLCAAAPG
ncbi:ADP-ribosylglycohydrolase family protein [Methanofollis aquaemaris]|uniref:ADP-ribosylglycohydrolase family protein n=1 Tax=Methanofollis aquaemaris TaxID=126734 RepID=A0A8A3S5B1_9EURY|nr:ADP-ribosylglycohydrolase family protein [Methanofollis aquaemaris]QSZ66816.1 ADP-ribosylglycohydrolase family protein [Methanofollis aquaemaris]